MDILRYEEYEPQRNECFVQIWWKCRQTAKLKVDVENTLSVRVGPKSPSHAVEETGCGTRERNALVPVALHM